MMLGLLFARAGIHVLVLEKHADFRTQTKDGAMDVRSELVVGADGRHSLVRERAGLLVQEFGAPIDVLWMRLRRRPDDPEGVLAYVNGGHVLVMLNRGDCFAAGPFCAASPRA